MTNEQIEVAYSHCMDALNVALEAQSAFVAYVLTMAIMAILDSAEDAPAAV